MKIAILKDREKILEIVDITNKKSTEIINSFMEQNILFEEQGLSKWWSINNVPEEIEEVMKYFFDFYEKFKGMRDTLINIQQTFKEVYDNF